MFHQRESEIGNYNFGIMRAERKGHVRSNKPVRPLTSAYLRTRPLFKKGADYQSYKKEHSFKDLSFRHCALRDNAHIVACAA